MLAWLEHRRHDEGGRSLTGVVLLRCFQLLNPGDKIGFPSSAETSLSDESDSGGVMGAWLPNEHCGPVITVRLIGKCVAAVCRVPFPRDAGSPGGFSEGLQSFRD
jgi:hypothetical protein